MTQDQCKAPQNSSHFPHSPWVPSPLSAPGKPVAASQARARRAGCPLSLALAWGQLHVHAAFRRLHHPLGPLHPPAFTIIA